LSNRPKNSNNKRKRNLISKLKSKNRRIINREKTVEMILMVMKIKMRKQPMDRKRRKRRRRKIKRNQKRKDPKNH
jgi:hypothetical protein